MEGISGETDVSSYVIQGGNAPMAFYYPQGWDGGTLSNRLAMYYSQVSPGYPGQVFYMFHDYSGWPAAGFNGSGDWDTEVLVAEGSTSHADADYHADHPWAMLTRDGSGNKRIELFVQSQHNDPTNYNEQVIQLRSTDSVGDDFGICTSTCSGTFLDAANSYVAIAADGTSTTDYVDQARHGRIGWDYIHDPYVDAGTDEPFMLFMLQRPSSGSCADAGSYDDIGRADGAYVSSVWEWTVETDGGSPNCPVVGPEDVHDPGLTPLPNDEFKMYYKDFVSEVWYVTYWDGSDWTGDQPIELYWDGSAYGPDHECVENVDSLAYGDVNGYHEGLFFMLMDSDNCGATGFDLTASDESAIVFAELGN